MTLRPLALAMAALAVPLTSAAQPCDTCAVTGGMIGRRGGVPSQDAISSGSAAFPAAGALSLRSLAARAADWDNPRDHGAVGDGTLHPASELGITNRASLCAAYPWACTQAFDPKFGLQVAIEADPGAPVLSFRATTKIGVTIPTTSDAPPGANGIGVSPYGGIANGTVAHGGGLAAGTTVTGVYGGGLSVTPNTAADTPAATPISFDAAVPPAGSSQIANPGSLQSTLSTPLFFELSQPAIPGATTLTLNYTLPPGVTVTGAVVGNPAASGNGSITGNTLTLATPLSGPIAVQHGQQIGLYAAGTAGGTVLGVQWVPSLERLAGHGVGISGAGLAAGEQIAAATPTAYNAAGVPQNGVLVLSAPTASAPGPYAPLVVAGAFEIFVQDSTGIEQGDDVSSLCPGETGVQVADVNPATGAVRTSIPLYCLPAGAATVSFTRHWLPHVRVGSLLLGKPGAFPAGDAVQAVNLDAGTITPTLAITGTLLPRRPNYSSTQVHADTVTVDQPITDADAPGIGRDWLGIQDTIQAIAARGTGGAVELPAGPGWVLDRGVILPARGIFDPGISVIGVGRGSATLVPSADLGPIYLISCGDPTGTALNGFGLYAGGGMACPGELRNLHLTVPSADAEVGVQPVAFGGPLLMSGLLAGGRLTLDVSIDGFADCLQFAGDHTEWPRLLLHHCGRLVDLREQTANLYGDIVMGQVTGYDGGLAALSIDPQAYLSGSAAKPDFAGSPVLIELRAGAGQGLQTAGLLNWREDQPNHEWAGDSMVRDANIAPNALRTGGLRGVSNVAMDMAFTSAGNDVQVNVLPGGSPHRAYVDVHLALGLDLSHVGVGVFRPITGGQALILADLTQDYTIQSDGGVRLSGPGTAPLLSEYAAACQPLIGGNGAVARNLTFDQPGMLSGKVWPLADGVYTGANGAPQLTAGTLLETIGAGGQLSVERSGLAAAGTRDVAGVVAASYPQTCVTNGLNVAVAGRGVALPIAVPSSQAVGVRLYPSAGSGTAGVAATTAPASGVLPIAEVADTNGGSATLEYAQTAGGGAVR